MARCANGWSSSERTAIRIGPDASGFSITWVDGSTRISKACPDHARRLDSKDCCSTICDDPLCAIWSGAGIPRKIAMEISGHRTESVYRRYDIVSPSEMKLAATKMEAYLTERTQQPVLNPAPRKLQ